MASPGLHCLHGGILEKVKKSSLRCAGARGISGRWAVIPVEFSSCTNKAEGITKASKWGRKRGEQEVSRVRASLHVPAARSLCKTASENVRRSGNRSLNRPDYSCQERRRREVQSPRFVNHAVRLKERLQTASNGSRRVSQRDLGSSPPYATLHWRE